MSFIYILYELSYKFLLSSSLTFISVNSSSAENKYVFNNINKIWFVAHLIMC